jgi:glyoxylase-like metal-dependent hydrolase (beta-lactamase superfamily II)
MQILPGLYLINGSPYGRHQNGYLLQRDGATLLIDSGDLHDAETLPEVERNAARWGFQLEQASHLLITHAHFDHASHAAALQRRGIKVVASPETAEAMAAGDERCIGYAVNRTFDPCQADVLLKDAEELEVGCLPVGPWQVRCLAAPGHTDGLVVFEVSLNGERLWFTSDLFEAKHAHSGIDLPWTGSLDFDRSKYITSLARLLKLPPCDHVLPGHGPAAIGSGRRLLEMAYTEALLKWR